MDDFEGPELSRATAVGTGAMALALGALAVKLAPRPEAIVWGVVAAVFALLAVIARRKLVVRPGDMLRAGRVVWILLVVVGAITFTRGIARPRRDQWLLLSGGAEVVFSVLVLSGYRR